MSCHELEREKAVNGHKDIERQQLVSKLRKLASQNTPVVILIEEVKNYFHNDQPQLGLVSLFIEAFNLPLPVARKLIQWEGVGGSSSESAIESALQPLIQRELRKINQ